MTEIPEDNKVTKTEKEFVKDIEGLIKRNKFSQAHLIIDRLFEAGANNPAFYHLKGVTYSFEKKFDDAREWIQKAINIKGDYWLYMKNMGVVHRHIGDLGEAYSYFTKALETKKNDFEIYRYLSEVKKYRRRPAFLDDVEEILLNQELEEQDRAQLHFGAGKVYDDLKDYDNAFTHYQKGNIASGRRDDMAAIESRTDDLISVYSREYLASSRSKGIEDVQPVFIVGMPRSGTSLMEQLIASHPMGYGVGELTDINKISNSIDARYKDKGGYPSGLPLITDGWREGLGRTYLAQVTERSGINDPAARVADKQPLNFRRIGMIHEMFPDAKIIHMKRDPRDTCLSCYFQHFISRQNYSFDLEQLGHFYCLYERTMAHWQEVLPDAFLTVEYENLVENFEEEAKRVIDYIGLDWDEACLSPHKAKHVMQTASAWQVRQPIYTSSKKRWQNYEKHIEPLMESLEAHK